MITWWCSAQGLPWTWAWQPYPGVWLFVLLLAVGYWRAVTRLLPEAGASRPPAASRRELVLFHLGLVTVWIAADWPIGALGAGYLVSVHQLQFVLFVMVAPPLLLLGTPVWLLTWLTELPLLRGVARVVTRPVVAIAVSNAIVIVTHLPGVVDRLMPWQVGSFALDMLWLGGGLVLWWPVVRRIPELNGLSYPARFGYLIVATLLPGVPAAFLFFSQYPLYGLYELAPPVGWLSARDDQFVAGIIMKVGSLIAIFSALTILFFRWHAADGIQERSLTMPKMTAEP